MKEKEFYIINFIKAYVLKKRIKNFSFRNYIFHEIFA